jgi:hypothetical protein
MDPGLSAAGHRTAITSIGAREDGGDELDPQLEWTSSNKAAGTRNNTRDALLGLLSFIAGDPNPQPYCPTYRMLSYAISQARKGVLLPSRKLKTCQLGFEVMDKA